MALPIYQGGNTTIRQFPTKNPKKVPQGTYVILNANGYVVPANSSSHNIGIVTSVDSANNTVQVMDQGVFTTCTATATTGSVWATTGKGESKRTKRTLKCDECGKKIAEYYEDSYDQWGAWGPEPKVLCKTCHQIDKLKE